MWVPLPLLTGVLWSAAVSAALVFSFSVSEKKERKQSKAAATAALQSRPPPCPRQNRERHPAEVGGLLLRYIDWAEACYNGL
jgi:hypothetical protein